MKLLVGLGNPGEKYANTRHNVGYLLCETLERTKKISLIVRKSINFMNNSGSFVSQTVDRYDVDLNGLYVAHDDLDIKLGEYKIQFAKGPKVHNGINSIEKELKTDQFWRIRIGIENRGLDNKTSGEEYVLQDFTSEEKEILQSVLNEICKKLVTI